MPNEKRKVKAMDSWMRLVAVCIGLLTINGMAQTTVTTSGGTANTVPVFTGSGTLGNSVIMQKDGYVAVGESLNVNQGTLGVTSSLSTGAGGGSSISLSSTGDNATSGYALIQAFYAGVGYDASLALQTNGGNVGIGTTSPGSKLEVNGNVKLTSGSGASLTFADGTVQSTAWTGSLCGGDYAESVNVSGDHKKYEPGDVLVLSDDTESDVSKSSQPYSTLVAGIYSTKPGVLATLHTSEDPRIAEEVPVAIVGIVPCKVTNENGPIHRGDLLVTSSTPGHAMRGSDESIRTGAVIGKALQNFSGTKGKIEVLVMPR